MEIAALAVGLTEMIKKLGLPHQFAPLLAVILSVGFSIFNTWNIGEYEYLTTTIRGLLIGITSTGLYAAGQNIVKPKEKKEEEKKTKTKKS